VQVTLTTPSGAVEAPFVCTSTCATTTDARQGAYWAHLVYEDGNGGTVSTADELLNPAVGRLGSGVVSNQPAVQVNSVSANYSAIDQTVTLSARVTGSDGPVNGGTVTFTVLQGCTQIGSPATSGPVSSGAASATYILPGVTPAGNYMIQAIYNGSVGFLISSSSSYNLTIR
jgi:hypothetical protein